MICPKCGRDSGGRVCAHCGATLKKKPVGLIITAAVLAVVILVSMAVILAAPSDSGIDIRSASKAYVTAAFYANKVIDTGTGYTSRDAYLADLNRALDACRVLTEADSQRLAFSFFRTAYAVDALEGLDVDADTYGYSDDAADAVNDVMSDMRKDAKKALRALEELEDATPLGTNDGRFADAVGDAADALADADKAAVVVGSKRVSFAGIMDLGSINTALIGADIVVDGGTVYLGADGAILCAGGDLGDEVAVISGISGEMLDTGSLGVVLDGGALAAIDVSDWGEKPDSEVFVSTQDFTAYISDEIAQGLGFDMDEGNDLDIDMDEGNDLGEDTETGSGVCIEDQTVVGTWQYTDALISPWVTLNDVEQGSAEFMLDIHKQPSEIMMYPGQAVEQYLIFRPDGTGILYYDVEGEGIVMPQGFWWRVDEGGDILLAGNVTMGYTFEWDDHLRGIMQRFQNGDYSDFDDINMMRMRKYPVVNIVYLYQFLSGEDDAHVCIEYTRISGDTDFDYEG